MNDQHAYHEQDEVLTHIFSELDEISLDSDTGSIRCKRRSLGGKGITAMMVSSGFVESCPIARGCNELRVCRVFHHSSSDRNNNQNLKVGRIAKGPST